MRVRVGVSAEQCPCAPPPVSLSQSWPCIPPPTYRALMVMNYARVPGRMRRASLRESAFAQRELSSAPVAAGGAPGPRGGLLSAAKTGRASVLLLLCGAGALAGTARSVLL